MNHFPAKKDEITEKLKACSNGNLEALNDLIPLVYEELKQQARFYLKYERQNHTLQTTALVHEAYLRLIDQHSVDWRNRAHFFAIAATAMRRVLINYAVEQSRKKRGGKHHNLPLEEALLIFDNGRDISLVALDEALNTLADLDEQQSRIVELRFFGGLTIEETAEVLQISTTTVKREWNMAKSWLYCELNNEASE